MSAINDNADRKYDGNNHATDITILLDYNTVKTEIENGDNNMETNHFIDKSTSNGVEAEEKEQLIDKHGATNVETKDTNPLQTETKDTDKDQENNAVEVEDYTKKALIYGVNDSPPIHITIICGLQQGLLSLSGQLVVSLLVAEAVCASNNDIFKAKLLSSTLFMNGITTLAMNLVGIRLPLFQGAAAEYVVPLLLVASVDDTFCSSLSEKTSASTSSVNNTIVTTMSSINTTLQSDMSDASMDRILFNVQALQGSLMLAGVVHTLLGLTGLIGVLIRYVGPLTIVPTMILIFVFIVGPVLKFVEVNWGIAMSTVVIAVIMFLYLSKYNMPVPVWTPSGGCRIIRYPLHQVFAILISIIFNWSLCAILTTTGVLTDDPTNIGYNARTDARSDIISDNPWLTFPYPGQFGPFGFHGAAFISCMIATLISVLDSIGDYYACAKVCRVPAPPAHAVNRGIMIEGLCSFISGSVGCGHATSTYGGNIGAIGVTKVASRHVFVCTGILYILFGIFGKFSAIFITIPYPVLGGAIIVMFGIFFGVILSNLEVTNLSSPRNIAILGLSVFIGLMVPTWVKKVETPVETGSENFDRIMAMLLGNPNLCGTIIAFVLDNTVPGTKEERGIAAWHVGDDGDSSKLDPKLYNEGYEVYSPPLPQRLLRSKIMKYIPFLPYRKEKVDIDRC